MAATTALSGRLTEFRNFHLVSVVVRLAGDGSAYLLAVVRTGQDSRGQWQFERLDAFPVQPAEKTCPPATSPS